MYITISGNIGSGKTGLSLKLSSTFGWKAYFEDPSKNPYLKDFYKDMKRWAFNLQVHLLTHRLQQLKKAEKQKQNFIQDRSIYEDAYVFSKSLFNLGLFRKKDYETYLKLFETIEARVPQPDLMIYLKNSVPRLLELIRERKRTYEQNIDPDYLSRLNNYYEEWIASYNRSKILIIDCEKENPQSNEVIRKVANHFDKL